MFFSGIADESGKSLETQIQAHRELGWRHIEMRTVDGAQFTALDDATFARMAGQLADAGMQVSCFASPIANWARPIAGDFQIDVDDLKRSIPRMRRIGCPFIRVMSWLNKGDNPFPAEKWKSEAIRRMRELARIAEDGGVTMVLENCDGWAAQSAPNMVEFLATIASPALKVVFDTGNAPAHHLHSLDFYTQVKPHIAYVHIKDGYVDSDGRTHFTWPNEGHGFVRQILTDLRRGGYDGGVSIEPHLKAQIHLGTKIGDADSTAFALYVEYGRRLQALVESIQATPR